MMTSNPSYDNGPSMTAIMGQAAVNPDMWLNMTLTATEGACSVVAAPIEMFTRPRFGTRYFSPVTAFLSCVLMTTVIAVSYLANAWASTAASLLGTSIAAAALWAAAWFHTFRIGRLMQNMELEFDSEYEGTPLWFFRFLPRAKSYFWMRSICEPLLVMSCGIVLLATKIVSPVLALYVMVAAIALFGKVGIRQYQSWVYIRQLMDRKFRGPIIEAIANGSSSAQTVGGKVVPMNAPPPARAMIVAHMNGIDCDPDLLEHAA